MSSNFRKGPCIQVDDILSREENRGDRFPFVDRDLT